MKNVINLGTVWISIQQFRQMIYIHMYVLDGEWKWFKGVLFTVCIKGIMYRGAIYMCWCCCCRPSSHCCWGGGIGDEKRMRYSACS